MAAITMGHSPDQAPRPAEIANVNQASAGHGAQSGDSLDQRGSNEPNTQAQASSATVALRVASRGQSRRQITVELREVAHPLSDEELRQREQELERLIIKAACHRAVRLAGMSTPTCEANAPATLAG